MFVSQARSHTNVRTLVLQRALLTAGAARVRCVAQRPRSSPCCLPHASTARACRSLPARHPIHGTVLGLQKGPPGQLVPREHVWILLAGAPPTCVPQHLNRPHPTHMRPPPFRHWLQVSTALPESRHPEHVSITVKAFMTKVCVRACVCMNAHVCVCVPLIKLL